MGQIYGQFQGPGSSFLRGRDGTGAFLYLSPLTPDNTSSVLHF